LEKTKAEIEKAKEEKAIKEYEKYIESQKETITIDGKEM
jgi:hypothetical protein